ncbi:MAG TPA: BadF/BadG/BcrA/BcrD ATPase family protein [Bacilli bacterium]|nr:BadF/BadG/BcrA/BcrD ATPase family protein [Bacilli bacterium]
MQRCIIGVDAGGTKTTIAAFTMDGNIIYQKNAGIGSPATIKEKAIENIKTGLNDVISFIKEDYQVCYIQMGISGVGVLSNKTSIETELSNLYQAPVAMDSDAAIGLYSIVKDVHKEGVLVLAGTGSASYAVNSQNKMLLIGGWGHLQGEEGSAYAVVRNLTLKMTQKSDHGEEFSDFETTFLKELNLDDVTGLRQLFYYNTKDHIAKYAQIISKYANAGCDDAIAVLKDAGKKLAGYVVYQFKRLNLSEKTVIGFRGSFVTKAPFVKEEFQNELDKYHLKYTIIEEQVDPVYGAYYLAKTKLGE